MRECDSSFCGMSKRHGKREHMRRVSLLLLAVTTVALSVGARAAETWWSYTASIENLPATIKVDLALARKVPLADYPYLVITGTAYRSERDYGLPEPADMDRLNKISAKVVTTIQSATPAIHAGSFTRAYEQKDYVYVKDRSGIEKRLADMYGQACKGCKTSISVRSDPSWSVYKEFLFPNIATREFYRKQLVPLGITW